MNSEDPTRPIPPSARKPTTAAARDMHHLLQVNGVWCLRLTIDQGPKYKGKRIKISLGTSDPKEARRQRKRMFKLLREGGVKIARNNAWTET